MMGITLLKVSINAVLNGVSVLCRPSANSGVFPVQWPFRNHGTDSKLKLS